MKVYIENKGCSMLRAIGAVRQYVTEYGYKVTVKNNGTKINYLKGRNHVSCKKTKSGNYTFVVWLAV